jgi:glycerol-1-phosphate dehydrogenase [NAD(P)+]
MSWHGGTADPAARPDRGDEEVSGSDLVQNIRQRAKEMNEPAEHVRWPDRIVLEPGALSAAAEYAEEAGFVRILVVADANTYEVAGRRLERSLAERGLKAGTVLVSPNELGDVVADEASIVQVLLEQQKMKAMALVAAGSGTIHDITRYAAFTCGIPFVSVPTAPSVDGFTSIGAPLIIRGNKITVPAVGPAAMFADPDILTRAPSRLIAAGFGDMLGKYTSLFDWRFGALCADEPWSPLVADITERALSLCVAHAAEIGRASEEGIAALLRALIESGFAMLLFGQSHPASGAEHHLSHYWEMEFIRRKRKQLLHGAKVGVACAIISDLYRNLPEERLEAAAGDKAGEVSRLLGGLPEADELRELLRTVKGPATVEELGIDPELAQAGLQHAPLVRPHRRTLLNVLHRLKTPESG